MNVFTIAIHLGVHCDLTSVLSSIRQLKRRERYGVGIGANLCLCSIVLSPLVGYGGVDEFNSRNATYEGVTLTCNRCSSTSADLNSYRKNITNGDMPPIIRLSYRKLQLANLAVPVHKEHQLSKAHTPRWETATSLLQMVWSTNNYYMHVAILHVGSHMNNIKVRSYL